MDQDAINSLITRAADAKQFSHSPYSKFRVGSAISCEDGTIYSGCNVENASFPVGVCAERTAIGNAVSQGHKIFRAIAVITDKDEFLAPCGICRQSMREFNINRIFTAKSTPKDGIYAYREFSLDELLPFSFGPEDLGK